MRRLAYFISLLILFIISHHLMIYIHEWTHGWVAWIAGYKSSPFDICYGTEWFTLWDINECINYSKIYSQHKSYVVACIAILPTLLQMALFPVGLLLLNTFNVQKYRWLFAFVYFYTLNLLGEIYAYIPIRVFSGREDMFNFEHATGLSPWAIAIPGTFYVIWGMYQILAKQIPQAFSSLKLTTNAGRFTFKTSHLCNPLFLLRSRRIKETRSSSLFTGLDILGDFSCEHHPCLCPGNEETKILNYL